MIPFHATSQAGSDPDRAREQAREDRLNQMADREHEAIQRQADVEARRAKQQQQQQAQTPDFYPTTSTAAHSNPSVSQPTINNSDSAPDILSPDHMRDDGPLPAKLLSATQDQSNQ